MRLGAPVIHEPHDPESWITALREHGYRTAYCPIDASASREEIRAYAEAARKADIVIAEVGIWNNLLASDADERLKAYEFSCRQLSLADEIGAVCAVNISGSRGATWDGPHPDNFSPETFDKVVE